MLSDKEINLIKSWQNDWNKYIRDIYQIKLDQSQQDILYSVQTNSRVSVRAGTSRGKDYVGGCIANCWHDLYIPSKVICTAPTTNQAVTIMMGEISTQRRNAKIPLGCTILDKGVKHPEMRNWYIQAFKSDDDNIEAWSGFHSPNMMVIMTEASGMSETIFTTVEGILQGNSRFVIFFNPNHLSGEAYKSTRSNRYKKHVLNDLDAPNVLSYVDYRNGKIDFDNYEKNKIPGQVDGEWVEDKILHTDWCREIKESEIQPELYDFEWLGKYYRPGNLFRVKVLGEFPAEDEATLIPMPWIEQAVERWKEWEKLNIKPNGDKIIGCDIAGEGRDSTVDIERYGDLVYKIHEFGQQKHMEAAGYAKSLQGRNDWIIVDTIGEGAGVYSRLEETKTPNILSFKNSHGAKGLSDITGQLKFNNMRSYTYWAIRDWLNPQFNKKAMLPNDMGLIQELNGIKYEYKSDGKIALESKDNIKKGLGRSPDKADALAMTFAPIKRSRKKYKSVTKLGLF